MKCSRDFTLAPIDHPLTFFCVSSLILYPCRYRHVSIFLAVSACIYPPLACLSVPVARFCSSLTGASRLCCLPIVYCHRPMFSPYNQRSATALLALYYPKSHKPHKTHAYHHHCYHTQSVLFPLSMQKPSMRGAYSFSPNLFL